MPRTPEERKKWAETMRKYYANSPEYRAKHKIYNRKYMREYYHRYPEKFKEKSKEWRKNNPEKRKELARRKYQKLKRDIIGHYSNNTFKCACCGENEYLFLCIDHINNDGGEQRKRLNKGINTGTSPSKIYQWLRVNKYPDTVQVLCHNCNWGKRYGTCPHKLHKVTN